MPRIGFSKETLEGPPPVPDGLYEVRLEGFKPKFSKDKNSINLNPQVKIVNHPQFTGRAIFENLNTGAGWIIESFSECFGHKLVDKGDGQMDLVGEFAGPDDNPEAWNYIGPLTGAVGKVLLKQTVYNGKTNSKVDQWLSGIPGSTTKPVTGLAK